jgi:hypothetical protein
VEQVFAGFIVGFTYSIIVAPLVAFGIVRSSRETGLADRFALGHTNAVALAIVLQLFLFFVLTAVGMVLGLALAGIEDRRPDAGLGSPNAVYTLLVLALTVVVFVPLLLLPSRVYVMALAVVFASLFGWGLPWLAEAA